MSTYDDTARQLGAIFPGAVLDETRAMLLRAKELRALDAAAPTPRTDPQGAPDDVNRVR